MANITGNDMRWNGKLSGAVDLLYYDKVNVDVTNPPYSRRDRNSSFFLKTRKGYRCDDWILDFLRKGATGTPGTSNEDWKITDVKIVWDDNCKKQNGNIYYFCEGVASGTKQILIRKIIDGCLEETQRPASAYIKTVDRNGKRGCLCSADKLFTTQYVRGDKVPFYYEYAEDETWDTSNTGIQINRKEGGVMRGYMSDQGLIDDLFEYRNIEAGDYLVVYSSDNDKNSGFCGQVRTILGVNSDGEIMLNAPRLGLSANAEDGEVKGGGVSYAIFHEWGEVVGFATYDGVEIITNPNSGVRKADTLPICDFHRVSSDAGCIISVAADVNRVYFLYENGYIRYGGVGMNKFFSLTEDAIYAGKDKTSITMYRDMILAFGRRNIAVGLRDDTGTYARMYNQSVSIGLKNRYAYGEYNGDMLFVSNDNRLLALQFENNVGAHMLSFQDVGAYANPFIKAMLPTDEAFIGVDNNELRIFINSMSDIDRDTNNSKTTILKYDTTFQVWTVDILKYSILRGCYEGLFYGDNVYYRSGYEDMSLVWNEDIEAYEPFHGDYQVNISAFLLENEDNGMTATQYGTADLFHLASLQKLIVLLGLGRYSNEGTKIKITEWRGGWGREYEINNLESNDWVKLIGYAYNGEQLKYEFLKKKECVIDALNDGSKQIRVRCEEGHKIQDPIQQPLRCQFEKDAQLGEHNVCINDEVYELAPTMPLTIQLGDQENYNTGIKVEIISQNFDRLNFGGFMALLHLADLGVNMGGDGEYQVSVDSGC